MRYGIIGTGWIAESFIEGARKIAGADIAAVYSRTAEKGSEFAEKNKIEKVYTSLEEFSKGDFEAVYIASPNRLHYSQSKAMLEAGKHVICEKPITVEPEELEELQQLAAERHLIYMEAIMYMYNSGREIFRDAINKIGKISSAHFDFSQLSSKYPAYKSGSLPNIFNPKLATGCLMDLGVYCVYPAVDIWGMPDKLTAAASFMESGADGSGAASLVYDDKVITFTYSKLGQDYSGSAVFGDEGTVTVESISKMTFINQYDKSGDKQELLGDVEKYVLMGNEAKEFEMFIADPGSEKYALSSKTTLHVSRLMKQIRTIAGIEFE
ncbi:MAG: Gfo/Idh/MocA family oxidoreductase [Clostridia bacterium]|nr:Gfo/Idh/MocA family oxidoreductase [Clostridia bacterium]